MEPEIHPKIYLYRRIVAAKLYIDEHYTENIDIKQIAKQACFSKFHFLRLFKNAYGKTPYAYLTAVRIEKAKSLLEENNTSITSICYSLSFESIPSFTKLFKRHVGCTPHEYAKQLELQRKKENETPFDFVPSCFANQFGWQK